MKKWIKKIAVVLSMCMVSVLGTQASEIYHADYSAAMLQAMGQGIDVEEIPVEGVKGDPVSEIAVDKMSYTTDVLTVRTHPGTGYDEVSQLAQYTQINVIGVCDNGWSHVMMQDGTEGYVSGEFLSDIVPAGAQNIGESLGLFTVTYYCSCPICCGWWSGGPTASGAYPTGDWTVAADPDVLPLGTRIYINGHEYCVEDTGSGVIGDHIDIYVNDHDLAVNNGVGQTEVFESLAEWEE